jgi:hypothetical protein
LNDDIRDIRERESSRMTRTESLSEPGIRSPPVEDTVEDSDDWKRRLPLEVVTADDSDIDAPFATRFATGPDMADDSDIATPLDTASENSSRNQDAKLSETHDRGLRGSRLPVS